MRATVLGLLVDGSSHGDIASQVGVTPQAIDRFAKKHVAEIEALRGKIAAAVEDVTIRDKAERIRRLAGLYDGMQAIIDSRGLMVAEVKFVGGPLVGREVEVERFDAALVREMRGVLSDVAEEVGDIAEPKPPTSVPYLVQIVTGDADLRELLGRAFAARVLGAGDAGGVGVVREPERGSE